MVDARPTVASVERVLRQTPYRSLHLISCDVIDGVAVLSGTVDSFYLKQVAQCLVASLEGIQLVDNRLEVAQRA